jgi:pSer/pThr/pTyr-binding forkhead associated (FHA) protein
MARIKVLQNNKTVKVLELAAGAVTIGRAADNDIQLDDKTISSHHAKIVTFYNASHVEDLGSTNGTLVNDKKVKRHVLQPGDILMIGDYRLVVDTDSVANSATA